MKRGAWVLLATAAGVSACSTIFGDYVATGTGGGGATTGTGGGTAVRCSAPSDCPPGDACETAACTGGVCGLVALKDGTACPGVGHVCQAGVCGCPAANTCAGGCVDTTTDVANCGACGNACPAGVSCSEGKCDCPDGGTDCAGACTDTGSDAMNCGACGKACALPATSCGGGICLCPGGTAACSGACVDTATDAMNCGGCGKACTVAGSVCSASACECPTGQIACNGACLDQTADPKNCGSCGHECLGSMCQGGFCQPVVMASGQANPTGLAINDTYLVWANTGYHAEAVMKLPIAGGTPSAVVASAFDLTPNIAIDTVNVYWLVAGGGFPTPLYSAPLSGGTGTMLDEDQGGCSPGLALHGTTLYWTCGDRLRTVSIDGTNAHVLATGLGSAGTITADNTSIYWVELGGQFVEKMPLGGGTPTGLSTNATTNAGVGIASDGISVYWGPGLKVPAGGGTTTMLGISLAGSKTLAVDASNVYAAINQANGAIVKAPIDGSPGTSLALNQSSPYGIVVDATYVYWTNSAAGTVLRVPK